MQHASMILSMILVTTHPTLMPTPVTSLQSTVGVECGNGQVGNGVCPNGLCCFESGYCGWSTSPCVSVTERTTSPPHEINQVSDNEILLISPGTIPLSTRQPSTFTQSPPMATSTTPPLPSASEICGNGQIGNGMCANGLCCSKSGYCVWSTSPCVSVTKNPTSSPYDTIDDSIFTPMSTLPAPMGSATIQPVPTPTSTTPPQSPVGGTCGNGQVGNGVCANSLCCSRHGYCGSSKEHCGSLTKIPTSPTYSPIKN
mmetsp:Transcript_3600/g.4171  ORF Transcript_3600/g.4171 Transcript_3600/m.4171 type:complete len:256 (-) Transcript_3600:653-1420(-)